MVAIDRSFPNGSPVCDYWLSRCEGFTVRAGSRNLGVVEQLGFAAAGRVQTLVVRKRRHRRRAIETGQVLAVVPARQLLLARRKRHVVPAAHAVGDGGRRAAPVVVAAAKAIAALLAALAAVLWAFALRGAVELRLAATRLVRAAGDEIRDRKRERDLGLPGAELEHPSAVANEYAFALGHDRVEVVGEERISSGSGAAGTSGRSSGRTGERAP